MNSNKSLVLNVTEYDIEGDQVARAIKAMEIIGLESTMCIHNGDISIPYNIQIICNEKSYVLRLVFDSNVLQELGKNVLLETKGACLVFELKEEGIRYSHKNKTVFTSYVEIGREVVKKALRKVGIQYESLA